MNVSSIITIYPFILQRKTQIYTQKDSLLLTNNTINPIRYLSMNSKNSQTKITSTINTIDSEEKCENNNNNNNNNNGHESKNFNWWDMFVKCVVFAITGSTALYFLRKILRFLNISGTWRDGPWSYRIAYFIIMFPLYSLCLILTGTLFGRRKFFESVLLRMWSRIPFISRLIKRIIHSK